MNLLRLFREKFVPYEVANILIKYCIRKDKRCYLVVYGDGAGMVSLAMTIVAITPMALMLSLYLDSWNPKYAL